MCEVLSLKQWLRQICCEVKEPPVPRGCARGFWGCGVYVWLLDCLGCSDVLSWLHTCVCVTGMWWRWWGWVGDAVSELQSALLSEKTWNTRVVRMES